MLLLLLLIPAICLSASGLQVETGPHESGVLTATVRWSNGWRTARNHDAAWLVVKYRAGNSPVWRHALVQADGHQAQGAVAGAIQVPGDRVGLFVHPADPHRGAAEWTLRIRLDLPAGTPPPTAFRVFAIEMVQVPEGPFWLGSTHPETLERFSYYRAKEGKPSGMWRVDSEAAIEIGPEALYYAVREPQYQGDRQGPVPAAFPKGFRGFYLMKYEMTQGQYADFLNHLPEGAANFRAIHGGLSYASQRGSILIRDGKYHAVAPERPANWVSWEDSIAFADWMGLRPMTEFEFTKASRGPDEPVPGDYPWGTANKDRLKRLIVPPVDDIVRQGEADEARLDDSTRDVLGASYYWVMDLAGSVWERVVTPAHAVGRAFTGSHGDGRLSAYGSATNPDWPRSDEGGGFGYRGGGYYQHGFDAGPLNPHSRTEYRTFGAWGEGPRAVAYGFRAARTAP